MAEDRMLSDEVLLALIKKNSGGGGTSDYPQLTNKPEINGVTLIGDKSASDLSLASLDANGKVPAAQLPSYVDDVINGYLYEGHFYEDSAHTTEITGESGKIYVDLETNKTYRWSGLAFVEISESLALGETASTAYAGDKGKANADAITAIKDGQTIDSFGDVETALAGKQDALTAGDYIQFDGNEISVNREIPNETVSYEFKTKGTSEPNIAIIVTKRSNGSVVWEREYQYLDVLTPIVIDDAIKFGYQWVYAGQWTYEMLVASDSHDVGYRQSWGYLETKDYTEDFSLIDNTGLKLVIKSEMDTALSGKQDTLTFDDAPTDGSNNPVKSNGVYDALALKQDATDNNLDTTAKTIVGAINEHEGDISSLKSGLTTLDTEVNGDATTYPYADVITIEDAVPSNLADCSVKIEPVQDLHGYDHPWVGGAGKNEIQMTLDNLKTWNTLGTWNDNVYSYNNVTVTVNTDDGGNVTEIIVNTPQASAQTTFKVGTVNNIGQYWLTGCPEGGSQDTYALFINNLWVFDYGPGANANISSTGDNVSILVANGATVSNKTFNPMLCLSSNPEPKVFAPYTNICPISGHTEVDVQRDGVNIWDEQWELGDYDAYGEPTPDSSRLRSKSTNYIRIVPSDGYIKVGDGTVSAYLYFYDKNKAFLSYFIANGAFSIPQNAKYMRFCLQKTYGTTYNNDIIIALGSDATPYEPYQGKTYTIALGSTIYGGTIRIDSNGNTVIDVDDVKRVFDGSEDRTWTTRTTQSGYTLFEIGFSDTKSSTAQIQIGLCNEFPWSIGIETDRSYRYYQQTISIRYDGLTLAEFKEWLSNNELEVTLPLATPTTIQLTPQQIQLLKGQNTLTASTGQISVTVNGVSGAIGSVQTQANATDAALAELSADIAEQLPTAPTTDGAYVLTVTVADGTPTYSWESAT